MLNRLQVFTPEGHLLMAIGGFGILPGQFEALTGVTIDRQNRVFTSEQLLGRTQMFRYITNAEAKAEAAHRQAALEKRAQERNAPSPPAAEVKPQETSTAPAPTPTMKLPDSPVPTQPEKSPPPNQ